MDPPRPTTRHRKACGARKSERARAGTGLAQRASMMKRALLAPALACVTLLVGACGVGSAGDTEDQDQVDTEHSAYVSSGKTVGDWHLLESGYECLAAMQYFYPARFGVDLPVAGPGWDGDCGPHGACHLWLDKRPDSAQWERITEGAPSTYDLIVFPPIGSDIWGHIASVDHVENGRIYVMDDNYVGHHLRSSEPHTVDWPAYGWYHLRKLPKTGGGTTGGGTSGGSCVEGGLYCGGDKVKGSSSTLYRCDAHGGVSVVETCARGCMVRPGQDDACRPCVVGGLYCGGDEVSGDPGTLYRCTSTGTGAVVQHCAHGCAVHPGADDACKQRRAGGPESPDRCDPRSGPG